MPYLIVREPHPQAVLWLVRGRFEAVAAQRLILDLQQEDRQRELWVDLSGIESSAALGLWVLSSAMLDLERQGRRVHLRGLGRSHRRLLWALCRVQGGFGSEH